MSVDKLRNILVVEDNELNREILTAILSQDYNVFQAENGKVGLDLLNEHKNDISLIMLDIQMPVMNGYEFLAEVGKKPIFANIPIIVTTSSSDESDEIKSLDMGASDFVNKPYKTDIVLRRVSSLIRLSEASALINRVEYDGLTEVYSKDFFFINAEKILVNDLDTDYDMICSDVNSLKLINERYGMKSGDKLLVSIAEFFRNIPHAVCGRINVDSFAALVPHHELDFYNALIEKLCAAVKVSAVPTAVVFLGLYRSVDHKMSASAICDNAILAIKDKNEYVTQLCEYNENLKKKIMEEQMISDTMEKALEEGQFVVYYQPKHDLLKDHTGGAEALVRWIHPESGFMNPGKFIPVFEKNGFISKLDRYMIEQVCKDLRDFIDSGMNVVTISVNISRRDFENANLASDIAAIVDKYGIPHNLIDLEVTESAYTDTPDQIRNCVAELRAMGFHIELDDFGAGYSSLTVLDDLDLDVLKLDMSLVRNYSGYKRKLILQHIFSLADSLGMKVVAEGIETEAQVIAFRDMGCNYAQGFYYSRPIAKDNFKDYLADNKGKKV